MGAFIEGGEGRVKVPVPVYLIDHPKGRALYDSGLPLQAQSDPVAAFGRRIAGIFQASFEPGEDVAARLRAMDIDPASIQFLINSHLHFDHCGGNALLPNATLVVQRREWDARLDPKNGYDRRNFDHGHPLLAVEGEHDLFGDGSVVLLPTYGHTAGHQSLRLRCNGGDTVLAGDCCYFHRTLADLKLPAFGHDREEQRRSILRLREMQAKGARIVPGHDPDFWRKLPQAPAAML
jgi:glyoxylase-like metal-dependent hydrolase (beta-lactamase superfamily II)